MKTKKVKRGPDSSKDSYFAYKNMPKGFVLAGTFFTDENKYFVRPFDSKLSHIFNVSKAETKKHGLVDGTRVMFSKSRGNYVKITEVFGHRNDPGADVLALVYQSKVPHTFSEEVLTEAAALPKKVRAKDIADREDYRDRDIITIDGSDTKDIDDAISIEPLKNGGFELGVHIADVSHYVSQNSFLDNEAKERGTSIYLADRVIPMLPAVLSNGICSLNPNTDRLTLSCIMQIDRQGKVLSSKIVPSVIHSKKRFTYEEVDEILEGRESSWAAVLNNMRSLAEILGKKRTDRGALYFDLKETKIRVDETGFPVAIEARSSSASTSLIEEFMIVANETVAEKYKNANFVFRTHEKPDLHKTHKLYAFSQGLGFTVPVSKDGVAVKKLQHLLMAIKGTHAEAAIGMLVLRTLKQAGYTPENIGHYGLASTCYCHFTSPIRRYPDLLVHRAIKYGLKKKNLSALCEACSVKERKAEALEREVTQLKKIQYMADKIGLVYEGTVSGVVSWGVFIQLPNTVEGFIPIQDLPNDNYFYVDEQLALYGRNTKKRIRIGDPLRVEVCSINEEMRRIIFKICE